MNSFIKAIPVAALSALFAALPVQAAEINAGFPPQSIWVSKTSVTADETLEIFTVIHNGSDGTLKGTVVFSDNEKRIGTRNFELVAGTSELESIEWKAVAGEHKLSAFIESASIGGDPTALSQQASATITIVVAEPPKPPALVIAVNTASDLISETTKAATPVIQDAFKTAYESTEAFRQKNIDRLEAYLGGGKANTILGASSTATGTANLASSVTGFKAPGKEVSSLLSKLKQTAAAAALFTLKSQAIFYLLLIVALFGLLYLLFRWAFKRPNI